MLSECRLKSPLAAARDFAPESAKSAMGRAIPLIWEEQADVARDQLGFKTAPVLEQMMIEHIVLCWLRPTLNELQFSAVIRHGGTLAQIAHHERRAGAAQKRFTRASESLARLRKLARPFVQINVAA